jgi:uncharacterized Fe-S cluster protein YjdI
VPEARDGRAYAAPGVTVYFDARRCLHAAECLRGLPSVFDARQRPWIRADGAPPEEIAAVVRRCPSALHYVLDDGPPEEPDSPTSFTAVEGGPLFVRGDLRLGLPGGKASDTRVALCVCARSENAPFCDNACQRAE